ncbi:hypothetical protein JQR85_06225 [Stutzerimonas urumqiensis]|uniref:hypothetical protein n=1 Tax=Stutzerimonas urumqiensis TaxID=638269 RepID=UPI003DA2D93D
MSRYCVLIKQGEIRDFDDIYEGMIPDVISSAESIKHFLSGELSITQWEVVDGRNLSGRHNSSNISVTIDAIDGREARMITTRGMDDSSIELLKSKFNLSELE